MQGFPRGFPAIRSIGPLPEATGAVELLRQRTQQKNLTIRTLYLEVINDRAFRAIGFPAQVADGRKEWFAGGAAEGFNIPPAAGN